jgi:hypothetical protein
LDELSELRKQLEAKERQIADLERRLRESNESRDDAIARTQELEAEGV